MSSGRERGGELLRVTDLHTSFTTSQGVVRAVDGVSLSVGAAQTLGIVGESGSGKTALIRSIMGLTYGGAATLTGRVELAGRGDLLALSPKRLRQVWGRDIAMVFQNPMTSLNPVKTVGRQISDALRALHGIGKRAAKEQAVELPASVDIP